MGPAFNQPALWLYGPEEGMARDSTHCPICDSFLSGTYYRVNGQIACAVCAIQAKARQTKRVVLVRGMMLAPCAALGCLVLPFLGRQNWLQDVIGFFVLFVCARITWQLSDGQRPTLDGPYSAG